MRVFFRAGGVAGQLTMDLWHNMVKLATMSGTLIENAYADCTLA